MKLPLCAGSGEGSDHIGSLDAAFLVNCCKKLFPHSNDIIFVLYNLYYAGQIHDLGIRTDPITRDEDCICFIQKLKMSYPIRPDVLNNGWFQMHNVIYSVASKISYNYVPIKKYWHYWICYSEFPIHETEGWHPKGWDITYIFQFPVRNINLKRSNDPNLSLFLIYIETFVSLC
jgi:hypothetical protein